MSTLLILFGLIPAARRHNLDELGAEGADEAVDEESGGRVDCQNEVVEVDQALGGGDAVTRVARRDDLH